MVSALRTPDFYRVRLGIGRPPGRQDPIDFVLEPFPKRAAGDVAILLDDAADAVVSLVRDGLGPAQDRYNRSGPRP
jgi:PTH1 family peptidyl-tRNA hydrolase